MAVRLLIPCVQMKLHFEKNVSVAKPFARRSFSINLSLLPLPIPHLTRVGFVLGNTLQNKLKSMLHFLSALVSTNGLCLLTLLTPALPGEVPPPTPSEVFAPLFRGLIATKIC